MAVVPIVLAAIAAGAALVSSISTVVSAVNTGAAQKKAADTNDELAQKQAQESDYNAALARYEQSREAFASDAMGAQAFELGSIEAARVRARAHRFAGTQRARLASSGVEIGYGTAADIQASTEVLGELDYATALANAGRAAWGFGVKAEAHRRASQTIRSNSSAILLAQQYSAMQAQAQMAATTWGAVGGVAQGAGAVAGSLAPIFTTPAPQPTGGG